MAGVRVENGEGLRPVGADLLDRLGVQVEHRDRIAVGEQLAGRSR
jgi:hypothetical protein